jgi:hypothetical protein
MEEMEIDWSELVGRFIHPTQVAIIEAARWIDEPLSPTQFAHILDGQPSLSSTAYHVRRLAELEVLRRTDSRQVRGAMETFYRLALR